MMLIEDTKQLSQACHRHIQHALIQINHGLLETDSNAKIFPRNLRELAEVC